VISSAAVRPFRVPLRRPLETGAGPIALREGALLLLRDGEGRTGVGEAAPLPGQAAGTAAACIADLERVLPELEGQSASTMEAVEDLVQRVGAGHPAARFALESAMADLASRAAGLRMADWLAGGRAPRSEVPVNALVLGADPRAVALDAERLRRDGFGTFKLKVGVAPQELDVARVEALRTAVGADARIRLDANGAWTPAAATAVLTALDRFGIEYVEDPFPIRSREDIACLARVREGVAVPLAVDDAAANPSLCRELLRTRAADVLVLKPPSLGGLGATRALAAEAHRCGIAAVVTSSIDTAFGLTATLQLAASFEGDLPACGLATAGLLEFDLAEPPAITSGRMQLPAGPGLGVSPASSLSSGQHCGELS